jgi:exosome complex exonuclease RRP6
VNNIQEKESTTAPVTTGSVTLPPSETSGTSGMQQIEIPYVPPSQRQAAGIVVEDSIVIVGQTRKNKRKRAKTAVATTQDADGFLAEVSPEDDVEKNTQKQAKLEQPESSALQPFDFASVPNMLDDVSPTSQPDLKQPKKKKQKRNNGELLEASDVDFLSYS